VITVATEEVVFAAKPLALALKSLVLFQFPGRHNTENYHSAKKCAPGKIGRDGKQLPNHTLRLDPHHQPEGVIALAIDTTDD
jgi:hypothetical protein